MILFACILVSAAALFYVFQLPETVPAGPEKTRAAYLQERKEVIYENLRDLNFEYKAGKVPDQDYQSMKGALEEEAASLLSEISQLESGALSSAMLGARKGKVI